MAQPRADAEIVRGRQRGLGLRSNQVASTDTARIGFAESGWLFPIRNICGLLRFVAEPSTDYGCPPRHAGSRLKFFDRSGGCSCLLQRV